MQVVTRMRADVSLRDVTIAQDEAGWQGASDVTHRKRAEVFGNLKKFKRVETRRRTRRFDFRARWGETNLRAMGAAWYIGQMEKPS